MTKDAWVLFFIVIFFYLLTALEIWLAVVNPFARLYFIIVACSNLIFPCIVFEDKLPLFIKCFLGGLQIATGIWALVILDHSKDPIPTGAKALLVIESILFLARCLSLLVRLIKGVMLKMQEEKNHQPQACLHPRPPPPPLPPLLLQNPLSPSTSSPPEFLSLNMNLPLDGTTGTHL